MLNCHSLIYCCPTMCGRKQLKSSAHSISHIRLHLLGWLLSKIQKLISISKDMQKREPLCTVSGTINQHGRYGKKVQSFFKKLKVGIHHCHFAVYIHRHTSFIYNRYNRYPVCVYIYIKGAKLVSHRYLHSHVHFRVIHKSQHVDNSSICQWLNQ